MARTSRRPSVSPGSGRGREIGLDDREIPGGLPHIANPETHPEKAAVPARRHVPSINQHRVPDADPDEPYYTFGVEAGEKVIIPESPKLPEEHYAVPVYEVEHPGKVAQHRQAFADWITVPGNASDPLPVCAKDYGRVEILLLNEDAANDIRIGDRDTLIEGKGAILKHTATSYTTVRTQDVLYALGATANPCVMSVIVVTEVNN